MEAAKGPSFERGFRLGALRIDPATGEVSGPGGSEQLDPKVMATLLYMAQRARQVVPREELHQHLWPDAVVSDDALTRCFSELRRQFSRAGGDEGYRAMLEALPKRGYRLNAAVTPIGPAEPAGAASGRGRSRWAGIAAAVLFLAVAAAVLLRDGDEQAAPASGPTASIAVLPFADMSESQDQAYLADGVAEEILNRLAMAGDLRVTARTSSFVFRGEKTDISEIGRRLDVTHVLEGSLRRSGDRLRVTAQLIRTSDSSHVWSRTYDHELGDLFRTQDEIAASVASALAATLAARDPGSGGRENVAAFVELVQGNFFYYRRGVGDVERSIEHYRKAIELDPDYATAWAALAGAYGLLAWPGRAVDRVMHAKQGEAARRAVELDPGLAVAHARLAQYYDDLQDKPRAEELIRRAEALDPDEPLVLGFRVGQAVDRGDLRGAIRLQQRLVTRDPMALLSRVHLGVFLMGDRRFEEALAEFRAVRDISPELPIDVQTEIPRTLVLLKKYDEAQAEIDRLPAGFHRDQCQALLYHAPGRRADADAALAGLAPDPGDLTQHIRLAEAWALRGDRDRAFRVLEAHRAVLEREAETGEFPWVWKIRTEARLSPFLKPLHADPRWAVFLGDAG